MALDAQSNWEVEMSQPLKIPIRLQNEQARDYSTSTPRSIPTIQAVRYKPSDEVLLPTEILSQILSYISMNASTQSTFWACTLVSRSWYSASITSLYSHPHLHGGNFHTFVQTVCPSKNAHIRQSALAPLVKRLDMGELVHNASKSLTARLLGRLKGNIEEFIAPQASFGINSFAALSKCSQLRHLDLSLISASISNKLLFQTLKNLQQLETLFFPRSSSRDLRGDSGRDEVPYEWPPKLKALHLAGGIDDHFLATHLVAVGKSLERLSIQHCSQIHLDALLCTLTVLGPQLLHLTIRHPMSQLHIGALNPLLECCPHLIALRISADYITSSLFLHPAPKLQILDLDCSPTASPDVGVEPAAVYEAVEEGRMPDLRSVRFSARLAWNATEELRADVRDLEEVLGDREMEDPKGLKTGVYSVVGD
ncbi:F-box protein [Lachnellula subtilissima]|uniref:F-box protein n=1 Tax=Lachnellula subtilissima TaxID=602034 RepID=A0A8H8S1D0_9HELO|nr:F-box protein [Lachnellula subtilissima]